MTQYGIYDAASGEIRCIIDAPNERVAGMQSEPGEGFIEGATSDAEQYVDVAKGVVKQRSELDPSVATSTGQVEISGLPDGTMVHCEGQSEESSGTTTIEVDVPGTYQVRLDPPAAYKPTTLEIEIP